METENLEPWLELARIAKEGTQEQLEQFVEDLPDGDIALAISRLTHVEQTRVLSTLSPNEAAEVFKHLSDAQAIDLIENLEPRIAAAIFDELPSSEQADLLADLNREDADAILDHMDPVEAADARTLSKYDDLVAGGLMVTEFLNYREAFTVGDVVEDMARRADEYRDYDVQYAYVCDSAGCLTGVLRLRDLLLARRHRPIVELMIRQPVSVADTTPLDALAEFFDRHDYLGVPVTSPTGQLVGIVQKAAVDEAWAERQNSDFLKTQGIVGGEELRTMPLSRRASRRLSWLSVNILLNIMAASVIAMFQDTLSAVIALAVFLPIISDMSGCSGNQAVAVSLRELSLGLVRPTELFRVWRKEVSVGLINGAVLGLLIGGVAWIWQGNGYLGLVVGAALSLNTVVAVSIGGIVPLILKQFNVDPAVASGPLLTTVTDMCGFFFVLGIATLLLSKLT